MEDCQTLLLSFQLFIPPQALSLSARNTDFQLTEIMEQSEGISPSPMNWLTKYMRGLSVLTSLLVWELHTHLPRAIHLCTLSFLVMYLKDLSLAIFFSHSALNLIYPKTIGLYSSKTSPVTHFPIWENSNNSMLVDQAKTLEINYFSHTHS